MRYTYIYILNIFNLVMGETGFTRAKRLIDNLKSNGFIELSLEEMRNQIKHNLTMNEKSIGEYLHLMSDLRLIKLEGFKVTLI